MACPTRASDHAGELTKVAGDGAEGSAPLPGAIRSPRHLAPHRKEAEKCRRSVTPSSRIHADLGPFEREMQAKPAVA